METYSQSSQDIFVRFVTENKTDGCFLEIGSNHPQHINNSFILEKDLNWNGLMVEYEPHFETLYKAQRKSKYVIADATTVNYYNLFQFYNFPTNMDYLQIDLEVTNRSTLQTLLNLDEMLFDEYKFKVVTFEHDIYRGDYHNTRAESRRIFESRGYTLIFPDVSDSGNKFEDWWINKDALGDNLFDRINKFKTSQSMDHKEIIKLITQTY